MKQYLRYRCWDWILCILISIGLTVNVLSGFDIDDVAERMPVLIILAIILTLVYFLAAINKITSVIGILAGIVAFIGVVILCRSTNIFVNDAENSTQVFYVVIVAVSLAVFLVCRSRVGIVILFLLGNVIQAGASFLQFPCELWAYLLFLAGTGFMMFYRVYVISVMHSHTGKVRFKGFMMQNVCVCMAALVLASGIFVGIIKPLNPPTDELKLIQKLMSFEVLEKIGVSSVLVQLDKDKLSDQTPEDETATNEKEDDEDKEDIEAPQDSLDNSKLAGNAMDSMAEQMEKARAISYDAASHWYLWVILAAVIVCFIIWLRKYLRKKWLDAVDRLPRAEGVLNMYQFFLYGLSKAGYAKASNLTLNEYQGLNTANLQKFDTEQVTFARLTEIYKKAYYGRQSVSEEEYADYKTYYAAFRKNLCKSVGRFKYIFMYFRV